MGPLKIFRLVATEFAEIGDEAVFEWFEIVKPLISKKRYGKAYDNALAYLTAHKMKMAGLGDSSMGKVDDALRVGSYSEGEVSIGFSVSQGTNISPDAEYTLTAYGLQFLQIRRSCIIPILSSGER